MSGVRSAGALLWRSVSVAAHASVLNTLRDVASAACGSAGAVSNSIGPTTLNLCSAEDLLENAGAPNRQAL